MSRIKAKLPKPIRTGKEATDFQIRRWEFQLVPEMVVEPDEKGVDKPRLTGETVPLLIIQVELLDAEGNQLETRVLRFEHDATVFDVLNYNLIARAIGGAAMNAFRRRCD